MKVRESLFAVWNAKYGFILNTFRAKRRESIREYAFTDKEWKRLKTHGYKCVKVDVRGETNG
jgi:hypothetical protein